MHLSPQPTEPAAQVDLPKISVSVKAAVVRDNAILLLSYDDHSGFHYNLPGGKARTGEALREAVRRKVRQETGLLVEPLRLLGVVEYVPQSWGHEFGSVQKVQFNFLACPLDDAAPRYSNPRDPDQIGFEWVSVDSFSNVPLLPRINKPLLAALHSPLSDPFLDRW